MKSQWSGLLVLGLWVTDARAQTTPAMAPADAWAEQHLRTLHSVPLGRMTAEQATFDVIDYDLAIRLGQINASGGTARVDGQLTVQLRALVPTLSSVALNLNSRTMKVSAARDAMGRSLTVTQRNDTLHLVLHTPLTQGETATLTVVYGGTPTNSGFGAFQVTTHGPQNTPLVATLSEPFGAREWWPSKDHPLDKATATLRYTIPADWKAAGNGLIQSDVNHGDGSRTVVWRETYPISTYLVTLATTNYVEFTDLYTALDGSTMPVLNYVYPEHLEAARIDLGVVPRMIRAFAERFGEYPFVREKYGHAVFGWGGAMEHQTMTSYGQSLIRGDHRYDRIAAHELGHQWFGDLVTPAHWRDIWLNEGFASYTEAIWAESEGGRAALGDYVRTRIPLDATTAAAPVQTPAYDRNPFQNSAAIYTKGARVLHALRFTVGDSAFFAGVRDYLTGFSYGNATTDDLRRALEARYRPADPTEPRDLGWFFEQWVTGLGRPVYVFDWQPTVEPNGQSGIVLDLEQIQEGRTFQTPLEIVLQTVAGPDTVRLWNNARVQSFPVTARAAVTGVQIDPFGWVPLVATPGTLASTAGDDGRPTGFHLFPAAPNPFNPTTTLRYRLAATGHVRLDVFDALGRRVQTLIDGVQSAGIHSLRFDGTGLPTGVYLIRLGAGRQVETRRLTLLK